MDGVLLRVTYEATEMKPRFFLFIPKTPPYHHPRPPSILNNEDRRAGNENEGIFFVELPRK